MKREEAQSCLRQAADNNRYLRSISSLLSKDDINDINFEVMRDLIPHVGLRREGCVRVSIRPSAIKLFPRVGSRER